MVVLGAALSAVIGVSAGVVYAAAYAPPHLASSLRLAVDVLAGVPSIVVGYFGYIALVVGLGWHFSLLAGALALAIIMLPYVVRSTDLAFAAVPARQARGRICARGDAHAGPDLGQRAFRGARNADRLLDRQRHRASGDGAALLLMIALFLLNVVGRIAVDRYAARVRGVR